MRSCSFYLIILGQPLTSARSSGLNLCIRTCTVNSIRSRKMQFISLFAQVYGVESTNLSIGQPNRQISYGIILGFTTSVPDHHTPTCSFGVECCPNGSSHCTYLVDLQVNKSRLANLITRSVWKIFTSCFIFREQEKKKKNSVMVIAQELCKLSCVDW